MLGDLMKWCYGWVLGGDFPFWVVVTEKNWRVRRQKNKEKQMIKIAAMDFNLKKSFKKLKKLLKF